MRESPKFVASVARNSTIPSSGEEPAGRRFSSGLLVSASVAFAADDSLALRDWRKAPTPFFGSSEAGPSVVLYFSAKECNLWAI